MGDRSDLQRRVGLLRVTKESEDGYITVTVNSRGHLSDIAIDPRVYRTSDPTSLAEEILSTVAAAAAQMETDVLDTLREHGPSGIDLTAFARPDFTPAARRRPGDRRSE